MMQISRLQQLLKNPGETSAEDREGLLEWVKRYPYAGSFAMLLARASAIGGHIEQQEDLLKAASATPFRQPLFDLLLRTELIEEAREIHREIESEDEVSEQEIQVFIEDDDEVQSSSNALSADDPLEREALISAIERSIERDVSAWHEDDSAERSVPEDLDAVIPLRHAVSSPFSTWLSQRATEVGFGHISEDSDASQVHLENEQGLIDRFIASSPKIGPLREVDVSVGELAQASVMEDPTLVTETMARIYAKQGQLGKARKAYKLLTLKYPAKSTYFASQLKKLGKGEST
ncbi:MAG: hypothetical protein OSA37_02720 [Flavobacteriales bacterium]|nr:hypothetical protein [Flavobacteriales bacterium]